MRLFRGKEFLPNLSLPNEDDPVLKKFYEQVCFALRYDLAQHTERVSKHLGVSYSLAEIVDGMLKRKYPIHGVHISCNSGSFYLPQTTNPLYISCIMFRNPRENHLKSKQRATYHVGWLHLQERTILETRDLVTNMYARAGLTVYWRVATEEACYVDGIEE